MTQKQDLRERCSYLLILFKAKDKVIFEKYSAELAKISAEESTEFYHYLLAEYKKLVEGPGLSQAQPQLQSQKPVAKKKPAVKNTPTKKKAPAKKKAAKKAVKKVTKKVTKKTSPKKKSAKKTKKR